MEKELAKKYISLLNAIIQRETLYADTKNSSEDYSETGWDIENLRFNLSVEQFHNIFKILTEKHILEVTTGIAVPEYTKNGTQIAHDEHGHVIDSDQFLLSYDNVNLENAENFLEKLQAVLTPDEVAEIKNVSGVSTEQIIDEAGPLNLRKSGLICYENRIIEMRPGLKTLCEIFLDRPNDLINRDDILDGLGARTDRRKDTVANYVSALNIILKPYFGRKPIINHKKEGWIFNPQ